MNRSAIAANGDKRRLRRRDGGRMDPPIGTRYEGGRNSGRQGKLGLDMYTVRVWACCQLVGISVLKGLRHAASARKLSQPSNLSQAAR